VGRIDVGEYPEGIEAAADGSRVYVASWFGNTLGVIDVDGLTLKAEIPVGDGPRAFGAFVRRTTPP
jgi:YVTN family beta-propeller protein